MRRAPIAVVLLLASLGVRAPAADLHSINHVVVVMQENRSFDNYFGHLKDFDPTLDVEAEPADASNPNPVDPSQPIVAFHKDKTCEVADLDHSFDGSAKEYDNGAMDGFTAQNVTAGDLSGSRTMGYYTQADLPYYYSLADAFSIGDRYFASLLGPTFPNRFFLLAGTAFGHTTNDFPTSDPLNGFTQRSVFDLLDAAHISWKVYYAQIAFALEFGNVRKEAATHVLPIADYFVDAAAGTLPQVAFVDPIFVGTNNTENDEHPPSNIQAGQLYSSAVVNAFMSSPNWNDGALFLTYDENGGFYDHVPPPAAPVPDSIPGDEKFDRFGFRVPALVVSPFAKRHYVSHNVYDHTSILHFIETRYGLPTLTSRDAAADPMLDFFDFAHPNSSVPALPSASLDPQHLIECQILDTNRRGVGL